jgi:hypothetical protein
MLDKLMVFPTMPDGYVANASYFEPLYVALLEFRRRFMAVYNFITPENGFELPALAFRSNPKGILNYFLEKIPEPIGMNIHNLIKPPRGGYQSVENYMELFYVEVIKIMDHSRSTRSFNLIVRGPAQLERGKEAYEMQRERNARAGTDRREQASTKQQRFAQIHDDELDPYGAVQISDGHEQEPYDASSHIRFRHSDPEEYDHEDLDEDASFDDELRQMVGDVRGRKPPDKSSSDYAKSPGGCTSTLYFGKCTRGDSCPWKHDKDTLARTWEYYFDLVKNSSYNPKRHLSGQKPSNGKPAGDAKALTFAGEVDGTTTTSGSAPRSILQQQSSYRKLAGDSAQQPVPDR